MNTKKKGVRLVDVKKKFRITFIYIGEGNAEENPNAVDETLEVKYYVHAVTPALSAEAIAMQEDPKRAPDTLCRMGAALIADWDLMDEDGQKVSTSYDSLRELPNHVVMGVINHILDEVYPGEPKAATSDGG